MLSNKETFDVTKILFPMFAILWPSLQLYWKLHVKFILID